MTKMLINSQWVYGQCWWFQGFWFWLVVIGSCEMSTHSGLQFAVLLRWLRWWVPYRCHVGSLLAWQKSRSGCDELVVGGCCRLGFCSCTVLLQKKPVRESTQRQMSCSSSGSLSPSNQAANAPKLTTRREWKYIASEKTTSMCPRLCVWWFLLVVIATEQCSLRQHLPMSGCAGRHVVCDLLTRPQQPSDIPLCHPLPDEEPELRGPARGAGGAPAVTHALCSLRPGHGSPELKTHRSRLVLRRWKWTNEHCDSE